MQVDHVWKKTKQIWPKQNAKEQSKDFVTNQLQVFSIS